MRRGGAGKRRDEIEPDVRAALSRIGVVSWQVNGAGLFDLVCWQQSVNFYLPLELKSGSAALSDLQQAQQNPWPIARSVDQALAHFLTRPRA